MKKALVGFVALATFFVACKKEEQKKPVTNTPTPKYIAPKSYVRLTIDGKTVEARDTFVTPFESNNYYPMLSVYNVARSEYTEGKYDKTISINTICGGVYYNGKLKLVISATSAASDNSSAVDSFRTLNLSPSAFYVENLTDSPKVVYTILTGSKLYVSSWSDDLTEGKLKLQLKKTTDGSERTAEGEFKIYRK